MEEKLGFVMREFASWMRSWSCWSSFPEFLPSDEKSTEETRQRKRCLSASAPYTPTSCVCVCVCVCVCLCVMKEGGAERIKVTLHCYLIMF